MCNGTKTGAEASDGKCSTDASCFTTIDYVEEYIVKDVAKCEELFLSYGHIDGYSLCGDESKDLYEFRNSVEILLALSDVTMEELLENGVFYEPNTTGLSILSYNHGCEKDVIIPSKINGKDILRISALSFNERNITSVTMPNTIKSIGQDSFSFNQLTKVKIPNGVTSIERSAFIYNKLTEVEIPSSVVLIDSAAFYKSDRSNRNLISIVNKTGLPFDWGGIIFGMLSGTFETGEVNLNRMMTK